MRLYEVSVLEKGQVTMCEDCLNWFKDKTRPTDGKSIILSWKITRLPSDGIFCEICGQSYVWSLD